MSDDVRLDLLKDAIADSGLDGQTKDVLADDMRFFVETRRLDANERAAYLAGWSP